MFWESWLVFHGKPTNTDIVVVRCFCSNWMKLFSMEILYELHSPVVYKNVQLGLLAFGSEIVTFSWLKRKEKYESKMHALLSHVFKNKKLQIFYVNILWIFQVICKSTRGFLIHT